MSTDVLQYSNANISRIHIITVFCLISPTLVQQNMSSSRSLTTHYNKVETLTTSLFSLRLTMTAVICWSMKMSIVASRAGRKAANIQYHLMSSGFTSQLRSADVGCTAHTTLTASLLSQHHNSHSTHNSHSITALTASQCHTILWFSKVCLCEMSHVFVKPV